MPRLLPDFTVWGLIDYFAFFTIFSVVFTISSTVFQGWGSDVSERWGRN